ncbi:MAG: OmpA family protein [Nannocystis sp.]|nr:OmpA family protein [Nannocystis sp.]MBA3549647.1 OmpA family protein [Nannocystis sp.]
MKLSVSLTLCVTCLIGAAQLGCKPAAPAAAPTEGAAPADGPAPAAAAGEDPSDVHIEGDHLVIDRHINFAFDSEKILEDSFDLLDHIAQLLKNHPDIVKMHVIGHTDSSGNADYNLKLSERRANSVVEALRTRGVSATLDAAGKGMSEHLCNEDTEPCHEKNRRVEFLIEQGSP